VYIADIAAGYRPFRRRLLTPVLSSYVRRSMPKYLR